MNISAKPRPEKTQKKLYADICVEPFGIVLDCNVMLAITQKDKLMFLIGNQSKADNSILITAL